MKEITTLLPRIHWFWFIFIAYFTPPVHATVFSIDGDGDDIEIRSDGSSQWDGQPTMRIGGATASLDGSGFFIFELPDLPSGEVVVSASLSFTLESNSADGNADLYALDYRNTTSVSFSDYYQGTYDGDSYATAIQDNIMTPSTSTGTISTNSTGSANLVEFLNDQYLMGAVSGNFVILRLNIDSTDETNYRYYKINSADHSTNIPVLTFETAYNGLILDSGSGFYNAALSTSETGIFTAEFNATPSTTPMDVVIGLSPDSASAYSHIASSIRFNPSGYIDARDGNSYSADNSIAYAANTTYRFRLSIDVGAKTYSAYVTPPGGSEQTIGANYDFRTDQSSATYIDYFTAVVQSSSSGEIAIDDITITTGGGTTFYEAEDYNTQSGCSVASNQVGYTGSGFVDFGGNNTWIEWNAVNIGSGGTVHLTFRYANNTANDHQCAITLNGTNVGNVAFSPTGSWTTWGTATASITLVPGNNTIRLTANTSNGGPNLDSMEISVDSNTVNAPQFSIPGGTYSGTQNVTISTATSGATIRYTTDGSSPSQSNGTLYSSAVPISSNTTLKAIAYKSGLSDSLINSVTYTINSGGIDPELTNNRSGINAVWGGTKGVAYAEEYFYHDKGVLDRKIVYIRDDTSITLSHNANNLAHTQTGDKYTVIGINGQDGTPNSGDEGVIHYTIDGDMRKSVRSMWAETTSGTYAYSSAFSLNTQNYAHFGASGTNVVGTTGSNVALSPSNRNSIYWRGHIGPFGDEWHTMRVGDNDTAFAVNGAQLYEQKVTDGKEFIFVVNPKTPCLTVRATGDGEFYTTPPKIYFMPKIHSQTTYFNAGSGTVTFELRDLYGNDVHYRINGGSWIDASANDVTLDQDDFTTGSNTLEYYYEGNESYVKTRTVVKNPGFPSASETHGNRFWGDSSNWADIANRVDSISIFTTYRNLWRTNDGYNKHSIIDDFGNGMRTSWFGRFWPYASQNAFIARLDGMTATQSGQSLSYAGYAKKALLNMVTRNDPVGFELQTDGGGIPSAELVHRGYWDVNHVIDSLIAYDILIGYYRSNQYTGGITEIEDYMIRDLLAQFVHQANMYSSGNVNGNNGGGSNSLGHDYDTGGMWDVFNKVGAYFVTIMMPSYSTPYYGTSGMDGNTTTYSWTPFPDYPLTWKKMYIENDATLSGWPNLNNRFGIEEYLCLDENPGVWEQGQWSNRIGYTQSIQTGHVMWMLSNLQQIWAPSNPFPNLRAHYGLATSEAGATGLVWPQDGARNYWHPGVQNSFFPEILSAAQSEMLALPSGNQDSLNQNTTKGLLCTIFYYDHDWNE